MEGTPNYFGIIPAPVRYDNRLSSSAKLLYSELTALSNKEGYCWASNRYFGELYGKSEKQISLWFKQLSEAGYIRFELTKIQGGTLRKVFVTHYENVIDTLPKGKADTLPKGKANNTSSNNKSNKEKRKPSASSGKKDDPVDEFYKPVVDIWFRHHPDWQFEAKDGTGIKAIIKKLKTWQRSGKKEITPESTAAAFDYILSHPAVNKNDFLSSADPSTLSSKLNSIYEQIKRNRNGVTKHQYDKFADSVFA